MYRWYSEGFRRNDRRSKWSKKTKETDLVSIMQLEYAPRTTNVTSPSCLVGASSLLDTLTLRPFAKRCRVEDSSSKHQVSSTEGEDEIMCVNLARNFGNDGY